MGELYDIFSGELIDSAAVDTTFAKNTARYICAELCELGAADEFIAITGKHIQDLQIAITPHGTDGRSRLDLLKINDQYKRFAVINYGDLLRKSRRVVEASQTEVCNMDEDDSLPFALHWIFYELAADAFSNSVYMQHKINKYIADFNGQSPHWETEFTVAENFLREHAHEGYSHYEVSFESLAFRAGFAACLLKQKLLVDGHVRNLKSGDWFMDKLLLNYPYSNTSDEYSPTPLSRNELIERVSMLAPIDHSALRNDRPLAVCDVWDSEDEI